MSEFKLKFKTGSNEFEAEGNDVPVREAFKVFLDCVFPKREPKPPPADPKKKAEQAPTTKRHEPGVYDG